MSIMLGNSSVSGVPSSNALSATIQSRLDSLQEYLLQMCNDFGCSSVLTDVSTAVDDEIRDDVPSAFREVCVEVMQTFRDPKVIERYWTLVSEDHSIHAGSILIAISSPKVD